MPNGPKWSPLAYVLFFAFIAAGVMFIWLAEVTSRGAAHPFSYWYLAFVAYSFYGIAVGVYARRRLARELSRTDIAARKLSRLWFARELIGMCFALSPILTFAVARIFLKMSISYSLPWYALGFLLFILWRPSQQPASA